MVAGLAGVSRGTASRVLSGATNVSDQAVESVRRAAAELNYRPNLSARSLVTGRTGLVGLLVNEPQHKLWTDPFFGQIARGAHDRLATAGVALVLSLATDEDERDRIVELASTRLDGVLVIRGAGDRELVDTLVATGVPLVTAGRPLPPMDEKVGWVDSQNVEGARDAVAHLIATGRRRIAIISGPLDMAVSSDRIAGWREALESAEIEPNDALVAQGAFTEESGGDAMHVLLERDAGIDGVFASNDLMAIGALHALREAGRRVPDDIAVVGFDDIVAATADPALTTMAQDVSGFGSTMATLLLEQLGGAEPRRVRMPTTLVVRDSA
jgi:DNA-binding LacI/PurR family transcriptional regulator